MAKPNESGHTILSLPNMMRCEKPASTSRRK